MYRPSRLNLTSEMLLMISLKKDLFAESSSSSNSVPKSACSVKYEQSNTMHIALTLGVLVAERRVSHICQLDRPFRTRVNKVVAVDRVELCRCDHLCKLFHVHRLDVDNICKASARTRSQSAHLVPTLSSMKGYALKLWSLMLRFHRLTRKSSALM